MRVLVVGATGEIGRAVVAALRERGDEVLEASFGRAAIRVDISEPDSIRAMYDAAGRVDAVVSAAGNTARRRPLAELDDEAFDYTIRHKLMGQVNLVRLGLDRVADGGSFTLTTGVLGRRPMPGSAALSLVNLGLEGFARAAALEMPRGLRVNVVSPPWLDETLVALGMTGVPGLPAATVARTYVEAVHGTMQGAVLEP
jgi:NAD(P)-dependent dehydrogenase (short-subunit alcohol dehydrogenase family)